MGSCCGRDKRKKQDEADKAQGPLQYSTAKRAVGGRCPVVGCGLSVKGTKRWHSGTRVRITVCAHGHVSPI